MDRLVQQLKAFHAAAPKGKKVVSIHRFGIQHSTALAGVNKHELAERAGLSRTYGIELSKGANLAEYVSVTKDLFR